MPRDDSQASLRGKVNMIGVNVMFDHVDYPSIIVEGTTVPSANAVGVEISHKHMSAERTNAVKFLVGRKRILEVPQHKAAPHHVESTGTERHRTNISGNYIVSIFGRKHLGAQIDSDRSRDISHSSPHTTTRIEQSGLWQAL
jgi:hypothetical protein